MKLKPTHSLPSVRVAGRVPGDLHAELAAYAAYYSETVREPIAFWTLVVEMLRAFVDSDRGFQAWRRQHRQRRKHAGVMVDQMRSEGQEG
jgi:hypothetical protein